MSRSPRERAQDLGSELRRVRDLRGLSLSGAATPSNISATYLQRLERGEIVSPSPHILRALSRVLDVPYATLMQLIGYVMPDETAKAAEGQPRPSLLAQALSSADLTEEEYRQVAEYMAFLRQRRQRAVPDEPGAS